MRGDALLMTDAPQPNGKTFLHLYLKEHCERGNVWAPIPAAKNVKP
jgi:hypothetical protein